MAGGGKGAGRKGASAHINGRLKRQELPTLKLETAAWRRGTALVAGIDEAGRGPVSYTHLRAHETT